MSDTTRGTVHEFPDVDAGEGLTQRQRLILEHIQSSVLDRGYPPSMREIGEAVGLTSTSSVTHQLSALEAKGYLRRDPHRPRAIEVVLPTDMTAAGDTTAAAAPASGNAEVTSIHAAHDSAAQDNTVDVPLVGRIAAGGPILADQSVEDVVTLPRQLTGQGELFMLTVSGDSMIDAAICDGDLVVVRRQNTAENGDIVAVDRKSVV